MSLSTTASATATSETATKTNTSRRRDKAKRALEESPLCSRKKPALAKLSSLRGNSAAVTDQNKTNNSTNTNNNDNNAPSAGVDSIPDENMEDLMNESDEPSEKYACQSHAIPIPSAAMIELMKKYGPLHSTARFRDYKYTESNVKTIRVRFRRWFPDFAESFVYNHETDTYEPRLGVEKELQRREQSRMKVVMQKEQAQRLRQLPLRSKTTKPSNGDGSSDDGESDELLGKHARQSCAVPAAAMIELMKKYGPLHSTARFHDYKYTESNVQSIRVRFRRWFPDFAESFVYNHETDTYEPRLGVEKELQRREQSRMKVMMQKEKAQKLRQQPLKSKTTKQPDGDCATDDGESDEPLEKHARQSFAIPIPAAAMIELMKKYGPLHSTARFRDYTESNVKTIRVRFRRWFPDFAESFVYNHETDTYEPRLGVEKELQRREQSRMKVMMKKDQVQKLLSSKSKATKPPDEQDTASLGDATTEGDDESDEALRKYACQTHVVSRTAMIKLMKKYGPLHCDARNRDYTESNMKSIRTRFRRWFPDFAKTFVYDPQTNSYEPRLGVEGEMKRRQVARLRAQAHTVAKSLLEEEESDGEEATETDKPPEEKEEHMEDPLKLSGETMKDLMATYGPLYGTSGDWRDNLSNIKCLRETFCLWFPDFSESFVYEPKTQKYVPILGVAKEHDRRRESRKNRPGPSEDGASKGDGKSATNAGNIVDDVDKEASKQETENENNDGDDEPETPEDYDQDERATAHESLPANNTANTPIEEAKQVPRESAGRTAELNIGTNIWSACGELVQRVMSADPAVQMQTLNAVRRINIALRQTTPATACALIEKVVADVRNNT